MSDILLHIDDPSGAGEARRQAERLARSAGFSDSDAGKVALVATETASNLVKHAGHGEMVLGVLGRAVIQILGLDRGPGLGSRAESLRDGFSTTGTAGTGLGAIQRLSTVFDLYSARDKGTAVLSQISNENQVRAESAPLGTGAVSVPVVGEEVCGDAWEEVAASQPVILVADGLGHGPDAHLAAERARGAFLTGPGDDLGLIFARMNDRLRGTRGAAAAVARLDAATRTVRFAGVGNIAGVVLSGTGRRALVSQNGTVGGPMPVMRTVTEPLPERGLLVLHSDGVSARWTFDSYPGLMSHHPALIAGVLFRDFARPRDDATVVVKRLEG